MVEQDRWSLPVQLLRFHEIGRYWLQPIDIEYQLFEHKSGPLFDRERAGADRALPRRQVAEQPVKFAPARLGALNLLGRCFQSHANSSADQTIEKHTPCCVYHAPPRLFSLKCVSSAEPGKPS